MPKNRKDKGSTSTMTRIMIGILVLTMVVPVFASLLSIM